MQGMIGTTKGDGMAEENGLADERMKSCRERIIRCPRLGGEVPFSYCEREAGELPCRQVVRCWSAGFPVEEYLHEALTPEVWDRFRSEAPKDRLTTLLDIVDAARQRRKKQCEAGEKRLNTDCDHSGD
ncbi:MAG: hypothetical protein COS57_01390 [Syntrophobacterales bacterium CG03_land_8_20_14_0_80_58_14]|nr:MAG: hypothetical protein COS57_01390 [Syntrophobacterales bacterium CG03_land_8_20_14_0_80_58_14]